MVLQQVIRSHGGVSYVWSDGQVIECRPRGRMRFDGQTVVTGDFVAITITGPGQGRIERVLERRTVLDRPPIANVDQALVMCTVQEPPLDLRFLDRVLVQVAHAGVAAVLVINKVDMTPPAELAALSQLYAGAGYSVVPISAMLGLGLDQLWELLTGRVTVLAGQSGVGKSRLTGALLDRDVPVGELSARLHHGRHTTRHVELLPLPGGGLLADAPGFTHLEFADIEDTELSQLFPDLARPAGACRFDDCRHRAEPNCAVKAAVAAGTVARSRYEHYLEFLSEIEAMRKW